MKFFDLSEQYKELKKEIDEAVVKVMKDSYFIGGKVVDDFEKGIADFCNVKYAISMNSGTDALFLALKAIGIKEGDEVITSPFTFIATAEVIVNCGAKPVFADIDLETFNIDAKKIEEKINSKTKAIIPVHLFGQMADMDKISEIAKKYNLFVIEDACQAIGAEYKGLKAGNFGDISAFSFFPTKNLGAYADAGMAVSNNKDLSEKLYLLKNHGSSPENKYKHILIGMNSRLDAMQAAVLGVKLKYLEEWNKRRFEIAQYYTNGLKGISQIQCPRIKENRSHIFHQYTIMVQDRDDLIKFLKEKEIPTMVYYPIPLHLQEAFDFLGHKKGDFLNSERASETVISLPIYPEIKKDDQDKVIKAIKDFYIISS